MCKLSLALFRGIESCAPKDAKGNTSINRDLQESGCIPIEFYFHLHSWSYNSHNVLDFIFYQLCCTSTMNPPRHRAPQLFRGNIIEGPDAFKNVLETVRFQIGRYTPFLPVRSRRGNAWSGSSSRQSSLQSPWTLKSLVNIQLGLIILWIITLKWGEETTFDRKVRDCAWGQWESWVGHGHFGA